MWRLERRNAADELCWLVRTWKLETGTCWLLAAAGCWLLAAGCCWLLATTVQLYTEEQAKLGLEHGLPDWCTGVTLGWSLEPGMPGMLFFFFLPAPCLCVVGCGLGLEKRWKLVIEKHAPPSLSLSEKRIFA